MKKVGIWMSEKKRQKLKWEELTETFRQSGYEFVKLNLSESFDEQGPIDVFILKLTDIIAIADQGDEKAKEVIAKVEQYLSNHPEIVIIDPLVNVRILLNRTRYYTIIDRDPTFKRHSIFTPPFVELTSNNINENTKILRERGVQFPAVCKPTAAHGSKSAHEMSLIFNARGLRVCRPPCVLQTFVNHNAVLYKVFIVGNRYFIAERPSLKNFYASENLEPIHYNTGDVCKVDSQSTLSILDETDRHQAQLKVTIDESKIRLIIKKLQREIRLSLFGFDVVIDNSNGNHNIIDINVFPGYDNYPRFSDSLVHCVGERLKERDGAINRVVRESEILDNCDVSCNDLINVSKMEV